MYAPEKPCGKGICHRVEAITRLPIPSMSGHSPDHGLRITRLAGHEGRRVAKGIRFTHREARDEPLVADLENAGVTNSDCPPGATMFVGSQRCSKLYDEQGCEGAPSQTWLLVPLNWGSPPFPLHGVVADDLVPATNCTSQSAGGAGSGSAEGDGQVMGPTAGEHRLAGSIGHSQPYMAPAALACGRAVRTYPRSVFVLLGGASGLGQPEGGNIGPRPRVHRRSVARVPISRNWMTAAILALNTNPRVPSDTA